MPRKFLLPSQFALLLHTQTHSLTLRYINEEENYEHGENTRLQLFPCLHSKLGAAARMYFMSTMLTSHA